MEQKNKTSTACSIPFQARQPALLPQYPLMEKSTHVQSAVQHREHPFTLQESDRWPVIQQTLHRCVSTVISPARSLTSTSSVRDLARMAEQREAWLLQVHAAGIWTLWRCNEATANQQRAHSSGKPFAPHSFRYISQRRSANLYASAGVCPSSLG